MKKTYRIIAFALSVLMAMAFLAGCSSDAANDTASAVASDTVSDAVSDTVSETASGATQDTGAYATSADIETEYHDAGYWKNEHQVEEYHPNQEITDGDYDEDLAVKCENGIFVGFTEDDVNTWRGIPYAQQPVGDLRFRAPQDAEESDKVYEARYYGHSCIQPLDEDEQASMYEQGEDCLYLNIWSSTENTSEDKPVLVYIHGGGWAYGGTADPMYDGELFAHYNPEGYCCHHPVPLRHSGTDKL